MCIRKKIAELQEQIDAKLKLKTLLEKTQPLLISISAICTDYREVAPEELPFLMDEILQAAQVDLSVAAISAIAATGNEKAQDFGVDALTQAIEQRASAAFYVETAEEVQQQVSLESLELAEECTDSIENILGSIGFYKPDVNLGNLGDFYDPQDKQGSYDGWDIYCSVHDSGQAMSIALSNEKLNQFWDVGTEFLADHDPTFPKSLSEKQPILTWVRSVIDLLPTVSALKAPEAPEQLSLEFPETPLTGEEYAAAVEEELALDDGDGDGDIPELSGNWEDDIKELTQLQKLLAEKKNSEFIFDPRELTTTEFKVPVLVVISSTLALETSADNEKAQFEVAIFRGNKQNDYEKATYYIEADTFLYQWGAETEKIRSIAKAMVIRFEKELKNSTSLIHPWWRNKILEDPSNSVETEEEFESSVKTPNLMEQFLITNLPLPHLEMRTRITPAIADGKFAGATFTFYQGTEELFSTSQTADEIARGENNPELIAVALAESWLKQQELKNLPPAGTTHTELPPKDDFTELVYLSDAVAYLKRKDSGEILTGYLGFSNKTAEGDRAPTMAKSRASKWQEHLVGVYQIFCSGPRECQRIESKNDKMPFKYELKLTKPSMGQLQMLAAENFGLYPNEIAVETVAKEKQSQNQQISTETQDRLSGFDFERVPDFDELNPEFSVKYKGEYLTRVWSSLRTTAGQQPQRLWRHRLLKPGEEIELKDTEAAAFHALQRTQGLA